MTKIKKELRELERDFRFAFSAPLVDLCNKDKPTLADINEILIRQLKYIEKALQEAREEGWQTGHKQTKEDYQAKEEEVEGRVEKIKELIKTDGPWTSEYDGYDEAFDKGYNKCLEDVLSILKPNDGRCKCGNPKMDESDFCKECI